MSNNNFVSPTGYVDLDNDCAYSIDRKSTRSREEVVPKEDLAFYFDTYIVPKYGLNNINVSNVASFMKDLEMNWTKLTPDLKSQVMDLMVDSIFSKNTNFREDLLTKLGISSTQPIPVGTNVINPPVVNKQSFTPARSKSTFGSSGSSGSSGISQNTIMMVAVLCIILCLAFVIMNNANFFKR